MRRVIYIFSCLSTLILWAQAVTASTPCNDLHERLAEIPRPVVIYYARRAQHATETGSKGGEIADFRQLFSPSGKVRRHLDTIYDAILDAHGTGGRSAGEIAGVLARHLDLPVEWAKSIVLYYDLEGFYRSRPEEASKVIDESRALGRPHYERTENGIPSRWKDWFLAFSNQKRRFEAEKDQKEFHPLLGDGTDAMWLDPVYSRWLGIMILTEQEPPTELSAWVSQHGPRLRSLWGYFVELENLGRSYEASQLIPGAAIWVGGQSHADAWKCHWSHEGTPLLVIDSLIESKASALGLKRGKTQAQRFLRSLLTQNAAVVFGHRVEGRNIAIATKDGLKTVEELRSHPELKRLLDPGLAYDEFATLFEKYFSPTLYELHLPKGETLPSDFSTVGTMRDGTLTRGELAEKFLQWISYRLNRRHLSWSGGDVTPDRLRNVLRVDPDLGALLVTGEHSRSDNGSLKKRKADPSTLGAVARLWQDRNLLNAFEREKGVGGNRKSIFGSFTRETDQYFDNHARHLPAEVQEEIKRETPVNKTDAVSAASQGYETPIIKIANRLHLLVEKHNEWAQVVGQPRIDADLTTADGIKTALSTLRAAVVNARRQSEPDFAYEMAWVESNLIDEFPRDHVGKGRKGPFGSFVNETDTYLGNHALHLPAEVQQEIVAKTPIGKYDGGVARKGGRGPLLNIALRLRLLVQKHNEWAQGTGQPRIDADLTTAAGIRQALSELKKAATEALKKSDPTFAYQAAWLERDLLSAFPRQHVGSGRKSLFGSFSGETDEYFDNHARHLSQETQDAIRRNAPVYRQSGGAARRGGETAIVNIANRLRLLVEKHNQWAEESGQLKINTDLTTIDGIGEALAVLRSASAEARKRSDPEFAYEMAWVENDLIDAFPREYIGKKKKSLFGGFTVETDLYFDNHARHLPAEMQDEIQTVAPVKRDHGASARTGSETAIISIAGRLRVLVQKHNEWSQRSGGTQITGDLATRAGVTEALSVLKKASIEARKKEDPNFAYQMAWVERKLILTFPKAHGGKKSEFGSLYNEADTYFDNHARHLPQDVRDAVRKTAPVLKGDGGDASKGSEPATFRIAHRFRVLVQEHNEWARSRGKPLINLDLTTPEGIEQALAILRKEALEVER